MTRQNLNRTLMRVYLLLIAVLVISLLAKFGDRWPGIRGTWTGEAIRDLYEYMKDMALVFVTVVAAYLANVLQKRSKFIENLEEEWRRIVRTKCVLIAFCEKTYPTADDYIAAYGRISETIDNMRIVYRNVGETHTLVGLYPYAPLHDMRRALQSLDPAQAQPMPDATRLLARDAIQQCFGALRENFLEELDLQSPDHPLLIAGGRRMKMPGATRSALKSQERQHDRQRRAPSGRPDVDALLEAQRQKEPS